MSVIRVFIGYDPRESIAFSVLSYSINVRATRSVTITPLALSQLGSALTRPRDPLQSTDFSFSRFLVPYLSNYEGWSIFIDCDMLALDDIANLWNLREEKYAVMVVKHNHMPKETTKFLNQPQTPYQKKNWSSVILFNNSKCRALSPEYVNTASGLELHQFKWLKNDEQIGGLPHKWNHLVGYDPPNPSASLVHFTLGGPYFNEYRNCEFGDAWWGEREMMLKTEQRN